MTISISEPVDGMFKYGLFFEEMNKHQQQIYCDTDYEYQAKIFYCKYKILSKLTLSKSKDNLIRDVNEQCKRENAIITKNFS
ncbi:MAG: hypothetical protein V6Z81_01710 [Parvularculales bacterium]